MQKNLRSKISSSYFHNEWSPMKCNAMEAPCINQKRWNAPFPPPPASPPPPPPPPLFHPSTEMETEWMERANGERCKTERQGLQGVLPNLRKKQTSHDLTKCLPNQQGCNAQWTLSIGMHVQNITKYYSYCSFTYILASKHILKWHANKIGMLLPFWSSGKHLLRVHC